MTTSPAQPHLEPLSIERCWELLETVEIGRVAITVLGEAPLVVPVNFRVEDHTLVFRTGSGTKLDAARRKPIALQADRIDASHRTGWSVLVRGAATVERARDATDRPVPWPGGADRRFIVRLWPSHVSGRLIEAADFDWETRGYL